MGSSADIQTDIQQVFASIYMVVIKFSSVIFPTLLCSPCLLQYHTHDHFIVFVYSNIPLSITLLSSFTSISLQPLLCNHRSLQVSNRFCFAVLAYSNYPTNFTHTHTHL